MAADVDGVIEQYLPLVRHVVFQVAVHFPRHVDREELARAGTLGLVEAAHRYDESRGVPFGRYAAQRIRGAILDFVRAADWAPRSLRNDARRVEATRQSLTAKLGRHPTSAEVASSLGIGDDELTAIEARVHRATVLTLDDQAPGSDEATSLVELLADPDGTEPLADLERRELGGYLRDAVALLPERHRLVIIGYFLEDRTSQEIARFLGVTESRVSQLRSEALVMLREGIDAQFADTAAEAAVKGRVARRKAAYATAIADRSDWRDRVASAG